MCVHIIFSSVLVGKEPLTRLTIDSLCIFTSCNFICFPFSFEVWLLQFLVIADLLFFAFFFTFN